MKEERYFLIAGPCVLESAEHALEMAESIRDSVRDPAWRLVFKSSFDKANRTSLRSYRGPGLERGLEWMATVKSKTGLELLTDIHEPWQAEPAGQVVDIIQIPAFLCRQTDLIVAAAETGRVVNLKKGQFMAPPDMAHAVAKARSAGAPDVLVTERGVSFGYQNLVVDLRSIPWMQHLTGARVLFDGTHSAQLPSAAGESSGGDRRFVPQLCRGALAAGCDGLFVEVHHEPARALSDGATQLSLPQFRDLLSQTQEIFLATNRWREISPDHRADRERLWGWASPGRPRS